MGRCSFLGIIGKAVVAVGFSTSSLVAGLAQPPPDSGSPLCNPGPHTAYFELESAEIRPDTASVLDGIYSYFGSGRCRADYIEILGFADSSERPNDFALATGRAKAARQYLVSRGFPENEIRMITFGSSGPPATELPSRVPPASRDFYFGNPRIVILRRMNPW